MGHHHNLQTNNPSGTNPRHWALYICGNCGGAVIATAQRMEGDVVKVYPQRDEVSAAIPPRPRTFLTQAIDSLHAPSGAVLLAASSIDAMLKTKGLSEGSLYSRIDRAAAEHIITADMAKWAHAVRLDANDQRHADESTDLPTDKEAQRCIDFTMALAEILFVLPSRVERGLSGEA